MAAAGKFKKEADFPWRVEGKKKGEEREKKKGKREEKREEKRKGKRERFATGSPHQLGVGPVRRVDAMNETVVLRASARSRACSSPQPANATGVGQFGRSPVAAAPRRRWSLGMAAASSCPQPLYGHTNVPVRERRGALRQRPCSATDRSNPPKQGPAARSYISSNGTRTSTVPYTYVGVVVTTFTLSHHRWPLSRGPWAHTRHRGGPVGEHSTC